jgi:hypothetical protein
VLCKRIDMLTSPRSGGSLGYNFIDHGAVGALILIGPQAVPALIDVLTAGDSLRRQEAVCALGYIGGERAERALSAQLEREDDPAVRQRIEEALKQALRPARTRQPAQLQLVRREEAIGTGARRRIAGTGGRRRALVLRLRELTSS